METIYREVLGRMRRSKWPLPEQYNKQSASRVAIVKNAAHIPEMPISGKPSRLDMSRSRAVLVECYTLSDESLHDLPGSEIEDLSGALIHPSGSGFTDQRCHTLRDAGRDQIMRAVAESAMEAEDLLLVYLSGHGHLGEAGELYYVASDSIFSEVWSQVRISDLIMMGMRSRAHMVLILDTAYAGAVMNSVVGVEECTIIASCGPYEMARHKSGFNRILARVFREGVPGAPAHLNALDIYREFERGVEGQRPRFSVSNITTLPCLIENHNLGARPFEPHVCLMDR
jgi:hypothetical protein